MSTDIVIGIIYVIGIIVVSFIGCYIDYKEKGKLSLGDIVVDLVVCSCFWWLAAIICGVNCFMNLMDKVIIIKKK